MGKMRQLWWRMALVAILGAITPAVIGVGTASAVTAILAGGASARAAAWPAVTGPAPGTITTIAGGVGGPAVATQVDIAADGATFAGGRLYVSGGVVRRVGSRTDWLTTPAGNGADGFTPDGGRAAGGPVGTQIVSADHAGNLVIFDSGRIRVVAAATGTFYGQAMLAGHIYTVAGTGVSGSSGDGGPALKARLNSVTGIAVDGSGNLLAADSGASRVRMIAERSGTYYGRKMTRGDIYTVAGGGSHGLGNGGPATKAELILFGALAVDGSGNLLIADEGHYRVRVVAARSGTFYGRPMTRGDIYSIAGNGHPAFSGDGGPATRAGLEPDSVAVDKIGNVLLGDAGNRRVRVIAARSGTFYGRPMTRGDIYSIAGNGHPVFSGDGGPATRAGLSGPFSVTLDGSGNVVIPDGNRVRVIAEQPGTFYGQPMSRGDIYTIAGNGLGYSGEGRPAPTAQISGVFGMTVDGHGNIIETDLPLNRIRVVARVTGTFYGVAMRAGDIYTVAGDGTAGFAGDGGPATDAQLNQPWGVAVDSAGNLVFPDSVNNRIRVVAASAGTFYGQVMSAGDIYTVAGTGQSGFSGDGGPATSATFSTYFSAEIATDGSGNVLIVDGGTGHVRMIAEKPGDYYGQQMTAGDIYTVAGGGSSFPGDGGPATSASLGIPLGVTVDAAGNLLIASGTRVQAVAAQSGTFYGQAMSTRDIYTIAGSGEGGDSGDGGPAVDALFGQPRGLAVDQSGNVIITDSSNAAKVRVIAEKSGVFYGISMTAGDIYTVVGVAPGGYSGDGGPATSAEISPVSVALDQAGNLLIGGLARIREVVK